MRNIATNDAVSIWKKLELFFDNKWAKMVDTICLPENYVSYLELSEDEQDSINRQINKSVERLKKMMQSKNILPSVYYDAIRVIPPYFDSKEYFPHIFNARYIVANIEDDNGVVTKGYMHLSDAKSVNKRDIISNMVLVPSTSLSDY